MWEGNILFCLHICLSKTFFYHILYLYIYTCAPIIVQLRKVRNSHHPYQLELGIPTYDATLVHPKKPLSPSEPKYYKLKKHQVSQI